LWASEKIAGAFCMPNIYKTGNRVLVQVGGKVLVQEYRMETKASPMGGTYKERVPYIYWDYKAQKNSVLSLDDKTGSTVWRSEKFDKRITDLIIKEDQKVFEFYGYEIESGKQIFTTKHSDANVGKVTDVVDFGESVVLLSEKGLAAYYKADGKRVYATEKIKGVDFFYWIGENYFLRDQRNSKNIIYGIDMTMEKSKVLFNLKAKEVVQNLVMVLILPLTESIFLLLKEKK